MSSATETLCGQAYGAKQYHMMGIYLQRSWIVDSVAAIIMLPLFIFAGPVLKLMGEQHEIAEVAGKIALWCIPFLFFYVFNLTAQMYLQARADNFINFYIFSSNYMIFFISFAYMPPPFAQ